ncbi:MAG: hypothetical protein ACR2RL_23880, partial [Gammaproteobacteria bacterium]
AVNNGDSPMNTNARYPTAHGARQVLGWAVPVALLVAITGACGGALADDRDFRHHRFWKQPRFCTYTARLTRQACSFEMWEEWLSARASCLNVSGRGARRECLADARVERSEARSLCDDQLEARRDTCDIVGEQRYDPDFDPDNFVDPDEIGVSVEPNPYLPLVPGYRWTYRAGDETVVVEVKDQTKLIEGVTCRVVNDVVRDDGNLVEDTDDWFAQDLQGNVWYCGEEVKDYEYFEGDVPSRQELVAIDGSFKIGRDGARAGILVLANPSVGDSYRQEFLLGEAEDVVEVLSVTATESAPGGACDGDCLQTRDFTPIDPEANEYKYYAPGVGLIVEVDLITGDRLELVDFETN